MGEGLGELARPVEPGPGFSDRWRCLAPAALARRASVKALAGLRRFMGPQVEMWMQATLLESRGREGSNSRTRSNAASTGSYAQLLISLSSRLV